MDEDGRLAFAEGEESPDEERWDAPPANAAERAYQIVKRKIALGEFDAGGRLTEAALSSMLQMSRTPIRAALVRLDTEGFVKLSPKRGAVISSGAPVRRDALFRAREALEVRLVIAAVANWEEDHIDRLDEVTARMARLFETELSDEELRRRYEELDVEFYSLLATFARRPRIGSMLGDLARLASSMDTNGLPLVRVRRFISQHRELTSALRARDLEWATSAAVSHIRAKHLELPDPG